MIQKCQITGQLEWEDSKRKRCRKEMMWSLWQYKHTSSDIFSCLVFPIFFVHTLNALTLHSSLCIPYCHFLPKVTIFLVLTRTVLPFLGFPTSVCNADFAFRNVPPCIVLNFPYAHTFYFLSQKITLEGLFIYIFYIYLNP